MMKSRYAVLLVVLGCFFCVGNAFANICKTCPPPQVRTLYTFDGNAYPTGLVQDARGNFYGVDAAGGPNGCGAVFQLSNSNYFHIWGRTDIYQSQCDINKLNATLVFDQSGAMYGTSLSSHSGGGTVFKLTNNGGSWSESIVYQFASYANSPTGGLLFDPYNGDLYGSTLVGIFQLSPNGSNWTSTYVYMFDNPIEDLPNGLTIDASGNIYGTTHWGGPNRHGTVFGLFTTPYGWYPYTLYNFQAGNDGAAPIGNLVQKGGMLYGMTQQAGAGGQGTLFSIPLPWNGTFQILHSFSGPDGAYSVSPLAVGANGMVYGATMGGGAYGWGVLFADQRSSEWTLWNFTGDPAHGRGFPIDILLGTDGYLYGLAFEDGIGYPAIFFTYP